jgi:hypothetical protein
LPREKLNSAPYAIVAKELAPGAIGRGDFELEGKLGIFTNNPLAKLHVVDTTPVSDQDEAIIQGADGSGSNPFQLRFGFRSNTASIQANRTNVGTQSLLLNPDGGNVGIGLRNPQSAALTIYRNNLTGSGVTNTLMEAGHSSHLLDGNRQFLLQQWLTPTTARTFLIGNGYLTGSGAPEAHDGPYTHFQALEFADGRMSLSYNHNGLVTQALTVRDDTGFVGIGSNDPNVPLEVGGDVKVHGKIRNESGLPAFLVSVDADDCGWPHPYMGCPSGYSGGGRWHVGGQTCDSLQRGVGYGNGSISAGWMVLCVAE